MPIWHLEELTAGAAEQNPHWPAVALDGDAPATLVYTWEQPALQRGSPHRITTLAANALNLITCWQISQADRFLSALPLFHVHGLANGCTPG